MSASALVLGDRGSENGVSWVNLSGTLGAATFNGTVTHPFRTLQRVALEYNALGGTLPLCWTVSGKVITVTGGAAVAVTGRIYGFD